MNQLSSLSLRTRIVGIVAFACFLCASVAIVGFAYFNSKEVENGIVNKEKTIHTQLEASRDFVAAQGGLADVIKKFTAKYTSAEQMSDAEKIEVLNQVPIYAALVIGKKNADSDHYKFRVFSDEPRHKENMASPAELEIFKKFEADKNLPEIIQNDGHVITTYRPVRLSETQGCMNCHGSPATSPWKNGTDIVGFKMEDWKDGKLHGVFAVSQDIGAVVKAATAGHIVTPSWALILAILAGALISILVAVLMVRGPVTALNNLAAVLSKTSGQVDSASQQIAATATQLSQAATEQAASLEETAASIEEMSSMVSKNSENAKRTAGTSDESRSKAEHGQQVVTQMVQSMDDINVANNEIMKQINESNARMADIVKVIQEIGNKTKVINEIVFQTKLLSFNASVEAARAGEHGKGFAVVADEVGKLAQMSGNASKEISMMLDGSMKKVESIVHETKSNVERLVAQGREKVSAGTEIAKQCGDVLNEIVQNVGNVSQMASEISTASQEQAQGVHELTEAMNQMDQVTQQNASTSAESARSAEALAAQSASLKAAVQSLLQTVQGQNAQNTQQDFKFVSKTKKTDQAKVIPFKPKHSEPALRASESLAVTKSPDEGQQPEATNPEASKVVANGTTPDASHPGFKEF